MKVGDVVTRSYVWKPTMMPGLIVNEHVETVNCTDFSPVAYDDVSFEVMWSDGTKTTESIDELLMFDEVWRNEIGERIVARKDN